MLVLNVFNLQFPENVFELNISGYKFIRVKEYKERFNKLHHTSAVCGGEFSHEVNIGSHQITATVESPDNESMSKLPWESANKVTKLQDVLLLLTLFTERNVFVCDNDILPISADPRCHFIGGGTGEFRSFINHEYKWKNIKTGIIIDKLTKESGQKNNWHSIDFGFEKTVNQTLNLIHSDDWQKTFDKGYFLFLFKEVMGQIYITTAFLICWTICEHLFALHNNNWLSEDEVHKMNGETKIKFIFQKYNPDFLHKKEEFTKIVRTRNRLIHFGKIPINTDLKEMRTFINFTQEIIAKILNLKI